MDPQTQQQMMMLLQQLMQVIQGSGQQQPGMPPGGMPPEGAMPPDGGDMPPAGMEEGGEDPYAMQEGGEEEGGMPPTNDPSTLHDRVQALESHTGLKKSAAGFPLRDRVDALERHWLGEEFDGPMFERVQQLEKAAGVDHGSSDPEIIDIGALLDHGIQSGIERGLQKAVGELHKAAAQMSRNSDLLPTLDDIRGYDKQEPRRQTKRVAAVGTSEEDELAKSLGFGEDDLDAPLTFGDALAAIYHGVQGGAALSADYGDDD